MTVLDTRRWTIDGETAHDGRLHLTRRFAAAGEPQGVMAPDAPSLVGHEEIRAWTEPFLDQCDALATYTGLIVEVSGDLAVEHYTAKMSLMPHAGGDPVPETVKGVHVYRRQPDGTWRIQYDVWNSDAAPGGA